MDKKLENELFNTYPILFKNAVKPKSERSNFPDPISLYGIQCGDGWYSIIKQYADLIEKTVNSHPKRPNVHATQVKQKWGNLRIYTDKSPEIVYGATLMIQNISEYICESCGECDFNSDRENKVNKGLCSECSPPTNY